MPCYLFTFHAYRSWLPDRKQGYVERGKGIQPPDPDLAKKYRQRAVQSETRFDRQAQQTMIDALLEACQYQQCRMHSIATDATHLHVLVSWRIDRNWQAVRSGLKTSLTRRLNENLSRQFWFSRSASRKRVEDRDHFDQLVEAYLPNHRGLKYNEHRGIYE